MGFRLLDRGVLNCLHRTIFVLRARAIQLLITCSSAAVSTVTISSSKGRISLAAKQPFSSKQLTCHETFQQFYNLLDVIRLMNVWTVLLSAFSSPAQRISVHLATVERTERHPGDSDQPRLSCSLQLLYLKNFVRCPGRSNCCPRAFLQVPGRDLPHPCRGNEPGHGTDGGAKPAAELRFCGYALTYRLPSCDSPMPFLEAY